MCCTYYIILLFSNLLSCSIYSCDHVTITVTMSSDVTDVWKCDCNITLTLTLDLGRKEIEKIKLKLKLNKNSSSSFTCLILKIVLHGLTRWKNENFQPTPLFISCSIGEKNNFTNQTLSIDLNYILFKIVFNNLHSI